MANVPFQTDLKKDFRNLQGTIVKQEEAYDNYCALRMAQKSVLKHDADQLNLEKIMQSLEHLREYSLAVLLLDFAGVNVVTLDEAETEIYISVFKERLEKLEKKAADPKQKKEGLDKLRDEIWLTRRMLVDVENKV